ncbi:hypothetical protein MRB53_029754 [Persea americana]|uniref:Uncharacterized protein n=1 Tax=Persea americana TaxID=3435 RepID=A0ACC2KJ98_PERAE|nr:hypothetical protein MRB53_029754 [Persea americana]
MVQQMDGNDKERERERGRRAEAGREARRVVWAAIPRDIPEGYFVVYVDDESKRYLIPLNYLDHEAFQALLSRAEEEFGYSGSGAVRLPCDTVFFDHLLWLLNRDDPSVQSLDMEELLKFYQ